MCRRKGPPGFFQVLGLWKLKRTHTKSDESPKGRRVWCLFLFPPCQGSSSCLFFPSCLALPGPASALGTTTGPWHPLAALLSRADPFIPWHLPQMDFSWLGGLAIKIKTRMNHLQFIHGESHKLAAPVSHCLSHMPKYPPFSGHFSHQSHQKNPSSSTGWVLSKFILALKENNPCQLTPENGLLTLILLLISKFCFFGSLFCSFDAEAKILGLFLFCKHQYLLLQWPKE